MMISRDVTDSLLRLVVVLASLGAFLIGQLVVNQGVGQQTPDILVVKQIDAEEVKLKDEGKSQSDMGVVYDYFSLPSFDERLPLVQGHSGFQFERLLCLGSRGPPKG
ncbi:MAG: hypothetical protein ACKO9H_07630 [Planctomycetota bacterium]